MDTVVSLPPTFPRFAESGEVLSYVLSDLLSIYTFILCRLLQSPSIALAGNNAGDKAGNNRTFASSVVLGLS